MSVPLRVLILEDRESDAVLMLHELRQTGYDPDWRRAETEEEFLRHLEPEPDVILADYSLPQFDAPRALTLLQERGLDVPFLVVTGALGDEAVVECMRQGAADYLLKDRLARLGEAVKQARARKLARDDRRRAEIALRRAHAELEERVRQRTAELEAARQALADRVNELQEALDLVKQLQGLLPMCSYCKKIRDDQNYWSEVETYLTRHTDARFSHGICPECFKRVVEPELKRLERKNEPEA